MNVMDARQCLALHAVSALSDAAIVKLLRHYGSPSGIWEAEPATWPLARQAAQIIASARCLQPAAHGKPHPRLDRQLEQLQAGGSQVLPLTCGAYPALLAEIHDPPPILYATGNIAALNEPQLGVVGARRASVPGLKAASGLASEVAAAGLHITSGLARGIDAAAHRGALESGGETIAVMATGPETVYPRNHRALARDIAANGCLVTEFPPGSPLERYRFAQRNRLISGLSLGVLVVEATRRSGSLITARLALEQGREVFTLPWSISHLSGGGCLGLLRDGATLVTEAPDLVAEIGWLLHHQFEVTPARAVEAAPDIPEDRCEGVILGLLGNEAVGLDEIVKYAELDVGVVLSSLTSLELQHRIQRCPGGYILL